MAGIQLVSIILVYEQTEKEIRQKCYRGVHGAMLYMVEASNSGCNMKDTPLQLPNMRHILRQGKICTS